MCKEDKTMSELKHPLLTHKLTVLRNKKTGTKEFRELVEEISQMICYEALKDADFVYGDVWQGLYENEMPKDERIARFGKYQVDMAAMKKCAPGAKYMHCLPASRGEEVTDEVMDSECSIVFDQAENRLTAMRGLLVYFMDKTEETMKIINKESKKQEKK